MACLLSIPVISNVKACDISLCSVYTPVCKTSISYMQMLFLKVTVITLCHLYVKYVYKSILFYIYAYINKTIVD